MNEAKILDQLTELAELNRINGIVPKGQEAEFLRVAAELMIADELQQIRKGICYSSDTEIPSLTESLVSLNENLNSIRLNLIAIEEIYSKEHAARFFY